MPTSSTGQRLVDSHYARGDSTFVDVRQFKFFKERRFDVRNPLDDGDTKAVAVPAVQVLPEATATLERSLSTGPFVATPRTNSIGGSSHRKLVGPGIIASATSPLPDVALVPHLSSSFNLTSSLAAATTPRSRLAPPALKPLFLTSGNMIWSMGRSRGMEACDREGLLAEERMHALNDESSTDSLVSQENSKRHKRCSEALTASEMVCTDDQQCDSDRKESLQTGAAVTPPTRSPMMAQFVEASMLPAARQNCVPRSPAVFPALNSGNANSARDPSRADFGSFSTSVADMNASASAKIGGRRMSFKSRNARLVRQLAKQSHALQERLQALRDADEDHRGNMTKICARMLAGLGYTSEMETFLDEEPPLPIGAQYLNFHALDHIAEVRVDVGPPTVGGRDNTREANKAVQWMSLLKQDVAVAASHEEAARASKVLRTKQTAPVLVPAPPPLRRGENGGSSSTTRYSSPLDRLTIDEATVASLAEERQMRELRYAQRRDPGSQKPKFSEVEQKQDEEDDKLRSILADGVMDAPPDESPESVLGTRVKQKRAAILDTSALESRLAGNADVTLLGPQAVVDLTLYRKNPNLFALNGQDTDPYLFPSFPFKKDELLRGRSDGVGITIFDTKEVAEDKAYTDRYNKQNLTDKLERTHIVRRLLNKVVSENVDEEDEDEVSKRKDLDDWRHAAGKLPSVLMRGDGKERMRNEMKYTWHQVTKDKGLPDLQKL